MAVDTSTSYEEAQDRKVLLNTSVLRGRAPRGRLRLPVYQAKWAEVAEGMDFPSPISKEEVLDKVACVPVREKAEYEEYKDMFFSRHGAYYIR